MFSRCPCSTRCRASCGLFRGAAADQCRHRRPDLDEHRRRHHGQDDQFRNLRGRKTVNSSLLFSSAFTGAQSGPTLLGIDVIWAGTMLAAVGVFAVLFAIYNTLTVRNPMTKRVKALNDRREQLKAGITASTAKRRARLVRKNQTADKMRTFLGKLQVLQDSQIREVQQKLAQEIGRAHV